MKKITLLLTAIIALTSCSVLKETDRSTLTLFADYRPYTEEGFLITPNDYTGEYESLGEITMLITPALKQYKYEGDLAYRGLYFDYETIAYDEIVNSAVKEAKNRGADALVNFKISTTPIEKADIGGVYVKGYMYTVEGFCIKRK